MCVMRNFCDRAARPGRSPLKANKSKTAKAKSGATAEGYCACGAVQIEIDLPAFWAWHDHSRATQRAYGTAYATFIGCWRSKVRVAKGETRLTRFEDKELGAVRRFCARCGTPVFYERLRSPKMVNIPRALFSGKTGREPKYHLGLRDAAEWEYRGEPLAPLKGYPGVMWERPRRKKRPALIDDF
jgi:hypothetical protein